MTIQLSADLQAAVDAEANRLGTTPESLVDQTLRQRFATLPKPGEPMTPEEIEEWVRRLWEMGRPYGVSLSDEQLSRESLYD